MDLTPPLECKHVQSSCSTPIGAFFTRKRKLDDSLDCSLSSPKLFSSTCNESIISNFKEFTLENSLPGTPEKQLKLTTKHAILASPIQESRQILYGNLKYVRPERRFGPRFRFVSPSDTRNLLEKILNINVIMNVIFKYCSGGDLFRFSLVSPAFYKALEENLDGYRRYISYKELYRENKENYVITPPGSPEKCESPPRTSSENLNKFIRFGRKLGDQQSLRKCKKCDGVAIVDKNISQCQNLNTCGLIYCLLCSSSSETGPSNFLDSCGHAVLRPKLRNMSNMDTSWFNFSGQDSGFFSGNDSSTPKVKRNLFSTSTDSVNSSVLTVSNRNRVVVVPKKKEQVSVVEVVSNHGSMRNLNCESPPRIVHAVGSKQSKRNLKRLTR